MAWLGIFASKIYKSTLSINCILLINLHQAYSKPGHRRLVCISKPFHPVNRITSLISNIIIFSFSLCCFAMCFYFPRLDGVTFFPPYPLSRINLALCLYSRSLFSRSTNLWNSNTVLVHDVCVYDLNLMPCLIIIIFSERERLMCRISVALSLCCFAYLFVHIARPGPEKSCACVCVSCH